MTRINGSTINPFGGNASYLYIDYTIVGSNWSTNITTVSWTLGMHFGDANVRLDNAQCHFAGGVATTGDPDGGPRNIAYPVGGGGTNFDFGIDSGTFFIQHTTDGHASVNVTGSVSTDWGSSSIAANFALPNIPQNPVSPSAATATRVSDSQANLAWTNNSNSDHPYANIKVYRAVDGGAYSLLTTLGVVTSYTDNTISANHKYRYQMSAVGTNGAEVGYATTSDIWTTPGTPSGCSAVRLSGGNIRVSWTNNVNYTEYTTRIEHSTDGGSSWAEIDFAASGATSYDHASPATNVPHKYRVRSRTSSGTTLNSGFSTQSGQVFADASAPSSCTAVRVNDTQATVSWTNNSTSDAPYANLKIYRATNGGGYALIATIGVLTSYTDNTISANNKYQYRVSALGSSGVETSFATAPNAVFTTPAADTAMTATKLAGGNIRIDWVVNSHYTSNSDLQHDLYDSPDGTTWNFVATILGAGNTYTHTAPSTGITHRYRTVTYPVGQASTSATSGTSNIIVLLSTANAPTGLAPAGTGMDATEAIVFTWVHNPTDGTPQSAFTLRWSTNGGSSWTTVGPTSSAVSSYTLPASTTTNGQTITWQVATAGQNGTMSAFSSSAVFTTSARPTSTITTPSGGTYTNSHLTAIWTYFQAQSSPQASWHAYLWRDNGDSTYTLLEEQTGTTETQVTFATTVLDGLTYRVRVYLTSAAGLTSADAGTEIETFTVTYLPPANVTLTASYNSQNGSMIITMTADAPVGGVTVAISTVDLQRQIDGGDWITWAAALVFPVGQTVMAVIDNLPTIKGTNTYRALVRSATPSSRLSASVANATSEPRWGFLNTGNAFSQYVRMRAELDRHVSVGRDRTTYEFAGREQPVELSGEHTDRVIGVNATLYGESSTPEEFEDLAETDGIVCWRDYRGRRMFASLLPGANVNYVTDSNLIPVSFTLRRVGYDENVG